MPSIWAIADLHLSFDVPDKKMDIFGAQWLDHTQKIESNWRQVVKPEDLVLIPGDISWAMRLSEVQADLEWIHGLPGKKVLIKGNHDYWWESISKIKRILPPSCHLIQNDSFLWNDVAIAGSRMWDTSAFSFNAIIDMQDNPKEKKLMENDLSDERDKIFRRELGRLEMSLKSMNPQAKTRIAMTHYPPIGLDLKDSEVSQLLEKYGVTICVFGHLHNVKPGLALFGTHHHVHYYLTACDYLNFMPLKILD